MDLQHPRRCEEVARLCEILVAQTGQKAAAADVHGRLAKTPTGATYTILVADGTWWIEQMRAHPAGWKGHPLDDVLRQFGI